MIRGIAILIGTMLLAVPARAQDPQPERPLYGVDYDYDQVMVPRRVDDPADRGTIMLSTAVYRPLKSRSGRVVVILHGSTGHLARDPREAGGSRPPWLGELLGRGDTVVVPLRRGRGSSTGTYVEECAFHAKRCSLEDINRGADAALADAMASTRAVLRDYVVPVLRPAGGKVALWGVSQGGFLSLHYAGTYPQEVDEVVAISPSWTSLAPDWGEAVNKVRLEQHRGWFAWAAERFRGRMLWIDGDADRFYGPDKTAAFFAAWKGASGHGERIVVAGEGHGPAVPKWSADLKRFLDARPNN
jgi:pimeloyl-ACP methyl ester carboxylesterase